MKLARYLERWATSIVILSGRERGTELSLDQHRLTLGRGPGVDLALEDDGMAREHAAIEFADEGFTISSLNGHPVLLNGAEIGTAMLKSGDRFCLGGHAFQFVCAERSTKAQ